MSNSTNPEEFYKKLKSQLEDTTTWPNLYLYKFILPITSNQSQELLKIFDNLGAVIDTKKSKTGKYVSYSIKVKLPSADAVIEKYKEVTSKIEGVISL